MISIDILNVKTKLKITIVYEKILEKMNKHQE